MLLNTYKAPIERGKMVKFRVKIIKPASQMPQKVPRAGAKKDEKNNRQKTLRHGSSDIDS